jgi:hypothetical protein
MGRVARSAGWGGAPGGVVPQPLFMQGYSGASTLVAPFPHPSLARHPPHRGGEGKGIAALAGEALARLTGF